MGKTATNNNKEVIKALKKLLLKSTAHASLEDALANIPIELLGKVPAKLPYSIWQLAEHIRIAQHDMLEFSRNPEYQSPKWPEGYWVKEKAPADAAAFDKCIKQIKKDRKEFIALLENEDADLYSTFEMLIYTQLLRFCV